ncbi:MAG TPA: hypothetical protein VGE38_06970 [Nocardioides sp.]|uniref:hypothetical protein n=1 Tax=Nocardioides sp. TaxID=35761 RepID=UPI002ED814F3
MNGYDLAGGLLGVTAAVTWLPSRIQRARARRRAALLARTAEEREYGDALYVSQPVPSHRKAPRSSR